jgi:hypothetical protein
MARLLSLGKRLIFKRQAFGPSTAISKHASTERLRWLEAAQEEANTACVLLFHT